MVGLVTSAIPSASIRSPDTASAVKSSGPAVLELGRALVQKSAEAQTASSSLNQPVFTDNDSFLTVAAAGSDNNLLSQFLSSRNTSKTEIGETTAALIKASQSQNTEIENLTKEAIQPVLNNEITNILEIESATPANNDELNLLV